MPVKNKIKTKRTLFIMPLIVVLMLICVIAICVVGAPFGRPSETAELDKNIEQGEEIQAAVVTGGSSITIEENGIYLIKLHGGHGAERVPSGQNTAISGKPGSLVVGYIYLERGNVLTTKVYNGGAAISQDTWSTKGGQGISVSLGTERLGYVSGGPGANVYKTRNYCSVCKTDEGSTSDWMIGECELFTAKVNTNSTASAGTNKGWTTDESNRSEGWCNKYPNKWGAWNGQNYQKTGGRRW